MSDNDKIYKQASLAFQKLSLHTNDILIIRFPSDIIPEQMELFADGLQDHIPSGVVVLCSREGEATYELLDEKTMNAHGWYRMFNPSISTKTTH